MVRVGERPAMICVGGSPSQARDRSPTHPCPPPPKHILHPTINPTNHTQKTPATNNYLRDREGEDELGADHHQLGRQPFEERPEALVLDQVREDARAGGLVAVDCRWGLCCGGGRWVGKLVGRSVSVCVDGWVALASFIPSTHARLHPTFLQPNNI